MQNFKILCVVKFNEIYKSFYFCLLGFVIL